MRPPYVPSCCCHLDPSEIRNDPGLAYTPEQELEQRAFDAILPVPTYLFRRDVTFPS
jgi:hypothetical protein